VIERIPKHIYMVFFYYQLVLFLLTMFLFYKFKLFFSSNQPQFKSGDMIEIFNSQEYVNIRNYQPKKKKSLMTQIKNAIKINNAL
jgi:hypothetical protein